MASESPPPQQQTVVQNTTEPYAEQKTYLNRVFQEAQNLFESGGPTYFPGSTVANLPGLVPQAQQGLTNFALNVLPGQLGSIQQSYEGALAGPGTVATDPIVAAASQAATQPLYDQLLQSILPGIRANAASTGNVGGSRQGIAEGLAVQNTQRAAGEASAGIYNTALQNALQSRDRALALAPQQAQLGQMPSLLLDQVGRQQFNYEQALLDDQIARHAFEQNLPSAKLGEFASLVSGGFGSTSYGTSTGQGTAGGGGSALGGALGGALAGASLGNTLFPGVGAGIGAAGGLLLGLFS